MSPTSRSLPRWTRRSADALARTWVAVLPTRRRDVAEDERTPEITLVVYAAVVGVVTGAVAALFRLALERGEETRGELLLWARAHGAPGALAFVAAVVAGVVAAAWLVSRVEPHAEGSGIPRVESIVVGRTQPGRARILPVKFVGGVLAIGSGLALGREGPSVQMGGNVAGTLARLTGRTPADMRALVAAGAATGLATAFAAPLAGAVFVLEELVKRFGPRTTLATLVACASGFGSARLLLGPGTDFHVPAFPEPTLAHVLPVAALGLAAGLAGAAYNRTVLACLRVADTSRVPVLVRAALIGLLVAAVAWWAPRLVGSGNGLTQDALLGRGTLLAVLGLLAVRFVLGAVSYAAQTPGGLFAPTLVLGSNLGLAVGLVGQQLAPSVTPAPAALALVGMAALFSATVQAPVTGMVLATEMTGSTVLLPPLLGACAVALLVARATGSAPIYDLLTERSVWRARANAIRDTDTAD